MTVIHEKRVQIENKFKESKLFEKKKADSYPIKRKSPFFKQNFVGVWGNDGPEIMVHNEKDWSSTAGGKGRAALLLQRIFGSCAIKYM
jgi:hypothetical protein